MSLLYSSIIGLCCYHCVSCFRFFRFQGLWYSLTAVSKVDLVSCRSGRCLQPYMLFIEVNAYHLHLEGRKINLRQIRRKPIRVISHSLNSEYLYKLLGRDKSPHKLICNMNNISLFWAIHFSMTPILALIHNVQQSISNI